MCGLAGEVRLDGSPAEPERVLRARERLAHRGPDEAGAWNEGPAAFGFRRLSILDLERGSQPMRDADGRWTVVFNGEIYNHPELKAELESRGAVYRTRSDTETLLHLLALEGAGGLKRLEGMFALALWDSKKRELLLARDGIGVKPLYYHFDGKRLAFASELRALAVWSGLGLDPAAVREYLRHGIVHAPRTALAGARKLPPGHYLLLNAHGLRVEPFWELPKRPHPSRGVSPEEAEEEVERLLLDSVRGQLLSDVPVGAFLSGGVDSSLIAALMVRLGGPVRTFSIGFSGARRGLDESGYARAVARFLGTSHEELILPADVLDDVEGLLPCLDEPLADSALLPTYLLSQFARRHVKVVLTGEGADELFAGYNRYKAAYLSEYLSRLGPLAERWGAPLARRMGRGAVFQGLPMSRVRDWARLSAQCGERELESVCRRDFLDSAGAASPWEWLGSLEEPHSLNEALAFDLRTILCDALLMKVDKASMRASLEARVPYLDRRLVAYALGLPASLKIRRLKGKYLLRRLAAKYLPRAIAFRRKHGFVVPWEEWVRSPASRSVDALLHDGPLARSGVFDMDRLRGMRDALRAQSREVDAGLFFRVLILGLWLRGLEDLP